MQFLSLCLIVKNEARFLHEWIGHHRLVGVEHFYVYDNGSSPPVGKVLREFCEQGLVTVTEAPGEARQIPAYNDCLKTYGNRSHWLGFIDCDEFLFPQNHDDMRELLLDYDAHAGLAVNCVIFGSSGHISRPKGLQTRRYRQRFPLEHGEHCLIKSLVQPKRTLEAAGVHHFHYTAGNCCVNERRRPVFGPYSPVSTDIVRINHYFYRSQQDYCEKLARGHADFPTGVMKYDLGRFYDQTRRASVFDGEIASRFPLPEAGKIRPGPAGSGRFAASVGLPRRTLVARITAALQSGDAPTAVTLAKAGVTASPCPEEAWLLLGISLQQADEYPKALEALYASIRHRETIEAFFRIFQVNLTQGNAAEARRIALYLRYRLAETPLVRESPDYAGIAATVTAFLTDT